MDSRRIACMSACCYGLARLSIHDILFRTCNKDCGVGSVGLHRDTGGWDVGSIGLHCKGSFDVGSVGLHRDTGGRDVGSVGLHWNGSFDVGSVGLHWNITDVNSFNLFWNWI